MVKQGVLTGLAGVIVVLTVFFTLLPTMLSSVGAVDSAADYKDGDFLLTFTNANQADTTADASPNNDPNVSSAGIIDCEGTNQASVCGTNKYLALDSVIIILPILMMVGALGMAALYGVQAYRGQASNIAGQVTGLVGSVVGMVVALVLMPVILPFIDSAVQSAFTNGYTTGVVILRLVPVIMLIGLFGIAATLSGVSGKAVGSKFGNGKKSGGNGGGQSSTARV